MLMYQRLCVFVLPLVTMLCVSASEQENLLPRRIREYCQVNGNECQQLLKAMEDKKNCMNGTIRKEAEVVAKKAYYSDVEAVGVARTVELNATVGNPQTEHFQRFNDSIKSLLSKKQ
jgi:hypothetical protein